MDAEQYTSPYMQASSVLSGILTWYHVNTESPVGRLLEPNATSAILVAVSVVLVFILPLEVREHYTGAEDVYRSHNGKIVPRPLHNGNLSFNCRNRLKNEAEAGREAALIIIVKCVVSVVKMILKIMVKN